MKRFKVANEKGSITMFVLIAMLFFLGVAISMFVSTMNSSTAQKRDLKKIQSEYDGMDTASLENAYNNIYAKHNSYVVKFCSGLPQEYQEVDYIKSTSTQYIDTLVHPADTVDFEIDLRTDVDAQTESTSNMPEGKWNKLFGFVNSSIYKNYSLNFSDGKEQFIYTWKNNTMANGAKALNFSTKKYNPVNRIKISCISDVWRVNEDVTGTSESAGAWKDETQNFIVFGYSHNEASIRTFYENMYLYNLKIWDNGELIRDFVPCYEKQSGIRGAFDTVNQKFYINKGTGEFEKGTNTSNYGVNVMDTQTFTIGETKKLSKNINTREGYTFTGWNTKPDGSGTSYTDEQEVQNLSTQDGDLIYLYAQWQQNP